MGLDVLDRVRIDLKEPRDTIDALVCALLSVLIRLGTGPREHGVKGIELSSC
jgi:hypothetical protein